MSTVPKKFTAFRIHKNDKTITSGFEQISLNDLTDGEVVIKVAYSDINYKDALAATGKGRILRTYPLVGGIDLSGVVVSSEDSRFQTGDKVLVCGAQLSELYDGGYAEYARVKADSVVNLPQGMSLRDVMALGTAGYTAALAIQRMEDNGQVPERGPIVVTGATGGVGSFAINMLSNIGYEVIAFTGKVEQAPYLKALGASQLINRNEIEMGTKPLENAQWGGAVDNVGGDTLSWLTRTTCVWGNIASIGLAGGIKLDSTVMPFILRGVSLLGINSVEMPISVRTQGWQRLSTDLKPTKLALISPTTIEFKDLANAFDAYVDGTVTGRTVVVIDATI
ncbi:oxidoreductase [Colwellia sp. MB3u-70]|uniref:oxidoreductase n=1 Tax=unclassified Colwellia TaxID=196834 RepID=UPI0015F72F1B|nr:MULTISPECIES: oxidoreductase [unclassified Colwellia]MBA6291144.1 oxidoreductase [Colwellia sp. MB3u-8]MBA6308764.1 oxidoreductase [Colwellia sp. MB3u-70]